MALRRALSAIHRGAKNRPVLDLNFAAVPSLDARITFTRSSTAWRINPAGLVESVASGTPRFTYSPTTLECLGLLIEEQRTNLLNFSQSFATAGGSQNNWADTNLSRDSTTATSPDGTGNALQISASSANGTIISTAAMGSSAQRVLSVWLRRVTGTGNIQYTLDNGGAWTTQAITTTWTRYSFTQTTAAQRVGFRIVTSGDAIEIWQAQLEAGNLATSDIVTTMATVTRSADDAQMLAGKTAFINGATGTFIADILSSVAPASFGRPFTASAAGSGNEQFCIAHRDPWRIRTGGVELLSYGAGSTFITQSKVGLVYSPQPGGRKAFVQNGVIGASGGSAGGPVGVDRIDICSGGSASYLNAPITRLRYWPHAMTQYDLRRNTL